MAENIASRPNSEGAPELEFDAHSVAIVAITYFSDWYPGELRNTQDTNKIRGDLALRSFISALRLGYQVVVADGPSSKDFKDNLRQLGIEPLVRETMERSVGGRQAIKEAAVLDGVRVIIKTEPEKLSLIEDCVPQIARPIIEGTADIVMPRRNAELNAETYPAYMYESEVLANKWYNDVLHRAGLLPRDKNLEFFFGPIALRNDPKIVSLFMEQYGFQGPRVGGWKYIQPEEWSDIV